MHYVLAVATNPMTERGYDAVHHCCGFQEGGLERCSGVEKGWEFNELASSLYLLHFDNLKSPYQLRAQNPKEMEMEMMVAALMFNSYFLYYEVSSATLTGKFSSPWPEHENSLAPLVLFLP